MPRFAIFSRLVLLILLAVFAMSASASAQSPLSTAIPYQGQLTDGGAPATGQYDFEFKLFDAASAGSQIGSTNSKENVQVSNGLFAVELDFGGSAFTVAGRFLEIGVRAGTSTGAFTALTPRRPLLAVPYALYSPSGSKPAYGMAANAPNNAAYVAANGNVGLGTTGPLHPLEIYNTNSANGAILITNPASATSEASIGFQDGDGTVWVAGVGGWARGNNFVIGKVPDGPKMMIDDIRVYLGVVDLSFNPSGRGDGGRAIVHDFNDTLVINYGGGAWENGDFAGKVRIDSGTSIMGGLAVLGPDIVMLPTSDRGDGGRAFVHGFNDVLHVNYGGEFTGGTTIGGSVTINGGVSALSQRVYGPSDVDALLVHGDASVRSLQIRGGADLAEPFTVTDPEAVEPGTVVVLDADHPGQVRVSATAYDTMVAGIVSGAGGINPGLVMNQEELTIAGESHPVALTGKVYVKAVGPIQVGDLLTTSSLPGHAMAATDRDRAFGATLGKAMSNLDEGTGLVLVLVSLQ